METLKNEIIDLYTARENNRYKYTTKEILGKYKITNKYMYRLLKKNKIPLRHTERYALEVKQYNDTITSRSSDNEEKKGNEFISITEKISKQFIKNRAAAREAKKNELSSWSFECTICGERLTTGNNHWIKHGKSKWEWLKANPAAQVVLKIPAEIIERECAKNG